MVSRVRPGVAQIITPNGTGSGSIIDAKGLVITNAHIVADSTEITVRIADGGSYRGSVLGVDVDADLAVVEMDASRTFDTVELANSDTVLVGDDVIAMGFPLGDILGRSPSITRGVVSSKRTFLGVDHLQTDAAINPGNSGGPLFDRAGYVIGVNTSKLFEDTDGVPLEGIGLAVSINEVKRRLDALLGRGIASLETPTPPPTMPGADGNYQNGKYGYGIDVADGWRFDAVDAASNHVSFSAPDGNATLSVVVYDLADSYTNADFADLLRNILQQEAKVEKWPIFEIESFERRREGGEDAYRLVYRLQDSADSCVSNVVERIALSSWYPTKSLGYSVRGSVCEDSLDLHAQSRETMLNSFSEWEVVSDAAYNYTVSIAPGWRDSETGARSGKRTILSSDNNGVMWIQAHELPTTHTLRELAESYRDDLKRQAEEEGWQVFEITSFQRKRQDGKDFYWLAYRSRASTDYCLSSRVAKIALSSLYPVRPYGYTALTGVCEHSLEFHDQSRLGMLDNFSY